MPKNYEQLLIITAGIVETARKNAGMTQKELADKLEVIQSTVSRIELGSLAPTLFHWMQMCKLLNIPHDAISIGYLDRCTLTRYNSNPVEGGYNIPKAYRDLKCIKVRGILHFLNYTRNELGENVYLSILSDLKMKPTFFVNLDNQVNLNFLNDFLSAFEDHQKLTSKTKNGIMKYAASEKSHGALSTLYRNADSQIDLMGRFINNAAKYGKAFTMEIEKENPDQITFITGTEEPLRKAFDKMGRAAEERIWSLFDYYLQNFSLFKYKHQEQKPKEIMVNISERENFQRQVTLTVA
jgi:DNA-binding XRE family transcriptional regulator